MMGQESAGQLQLRRDGCATVFFQCPIQKQVLQMTRELHAASFHVENQSHLHEHGASGLSVDCDGNDRLEPSWQQTLQAHR